MAGKYKAQAKWTRANSKMYAMTVYKTSEQDMIDWIEEHKPYQPYLKSLVRKDMEKGKD